MFDFVSTALYAHYYDVAVLVLVLLTFFLCQRGVILNREVVNINAGWGFVLAIFIILYIGLRPISSVFGDTMNYAQSYNDLSHIPFKWSWTGDFLFYNMMQWFSKFSSIHGFFLFCAFLYVAPLWLAMRRIFSSYYYVPFFLFYESEVHQKYYLKAHLCHNYRLRLVNVFLHVSSISKVFQRELSLHYLSN